MSKLSQTARIIEVLLFCAREPLTAGQAEVCLQEEVDFQKAIQEINDYYESEKSPLFIQEVAEGYKFMTRKEYSPWINRLYQDKGSVKLSQSALEVLSIIAYKQPTTKSEIDSIRGVDSYLRTLLDKKLISIKGRLDTPGKPLLYGTTSDFLEYFGLASIKDLPKMKEIEELVKGSENGEPEESKEIEESPGNQDQ